MDWNFIVADPATAIVGADFLSYHKLAIDVGAKRLIETEKSNVLKLAEPNFEVSHKTPCKVLIAKEQCFNTEVYKQMVVNNLPSLLLFQPPTNIESDICHVIKTNGQPNCSKVRKLSPEMTKIAKKKKSTNYWMRRLFDCTNQQSPQRGGAVPGPVWVGSKWLLAFPRVPVTPGTPLHFFAMLPPERPQKGSTQLP